MLRVQNESEMRYLLLDKDIEDRDSLDLITKHSVYEFLQSQFAENVVKEIWRSPYATHDSIQTASTNFFLLFNYYHCDQDEEKKMRFFNGKSVKKIENNSMQFTVWRYSGKSRAIIDMIQTIIVASLIHYLLREVLLQNVPVVTQVNKMLNLEKEWAALPNG